MSKVLMIAIGAVVVVVAATRGRKGVKKARSATKRSWNGSRLAATKDKANRKLKHDVPAAKDTVVDAATKAAHKAKSTVR